MIIGFVLDDTLDVADGVQQTIITLGNRMRERGHEIHYIVPETKRIDIPNIHVVGKSFAVKFNGNSVRTPLPASGHKIKNLFETVNFEALHVQMPYSPLLAAKVLKYAPKSVKKIGTFHILPYNKLATLGTRLLGLVLHRSLKRLDARFAVSLPALKFMQSHFGVDGEVLPNPINYGFFSSFKKQSSDKLVKIVFVGRFDERKGVVQLVKAYSMLSEETRQKTKLIMCGKGPLLEMCRKISLDLNTKIDFPGFISEERKAQELANADIAVFPSISGESFGLVLVEAMAAHSGVVLGGNNPGYKSVLESWPESLFNPKNLKQFKLVLEQFIADTELKKKIGDEQHGRSKQYDTDKIVEKLLAVYKS